MKLTVQHITGFRTAADNISAVNSLSKLNPLRNGALLVIEL